MSPATLFDDIVMVDWSASSRRKTGADSIWICHHGHPPRNLPTRHAAEHHLRDLLCTLASRRVLIGFDFAFGYPQGFAAATRLTGDAPWSATWHHLADHIHDDEHNRNNRWAVAAELNQRLGTPHFWGAPPAATSRHLPPTRPLTPHPLQLRATEAAVRSTTGRAPFTVWQLLGAGAVGGQTLTGIPVAHRLRHSPALAGRAKVWPFETGFTTQPCAGRADAIVLVEVWPSTVATDPASHDVKDARQVLALAADLAKRDRAGTLAARFAPDLPPDVAQRAVTEEGWVL